MKRRKFLKAASAVSLLPLVTVCSATRDRTTTLQAGSRVRPTGLFFVHHGVGSEEWSANGFTRLAAR